MRAITDSIDIVISDVVLRDGLQILSDVVPLEGKRQILDLLVDSGLKNLEVTSMVPPKLIPQFGDAAAMIEYAHERAVPLATVLVPNLKGAELAIAAGARSLVLPISVSETHSRKNIRKPRADQIEELRRIRNLIDDQQADARPLLSAGISTAFGCSYEGQVSEDELFVVVDACLDVGIDEIALADTVGYATPRQVTSAFNRLNARVDSAIPVRSHFHDTFGLGLANAFASIECGVMFVDASLCGLGGCPYAPGAAGNITLEDLVYMAQKLGLRTGINLDRLLHGKALLQGLLPDTPLRGALSLAGNYPADFVPEV